MTKDTGGQAFPVAMSEQTSTNQYGQPFQRGMTLRDYFAGQALAGLAASKFNMHLIHEEERCAATCYEIADAMLSARQS